MPGQDDDFTLADDIKEDDDAGDQGDENNEDQDANDDDQGDDQDKGKTDKGDEDKVDDEDEDDWKGFEDQKDEENKDDDDDDLTDAEKAAIDRRIAKMNAPVNSELQQLRVKDAVSTFLKQGNNAEVFKGLEDKIVKTALHKNAKDWPIDRVAFAVAGPRLLKEGARLGRAADEEAAKTKHSGTQAKGVNANGKANNTTKSGEKDYANMTDEELDAELEAERARHR